MRTTTLGSFRNQGTLHTFNKSLPGSSKPGPATGVARVGMASWLRYTMACIEITHIWATFGAHVAGTTYPEKRNIKKLCVFGTEEKQHVLWRPAMNWRFMFRVMQCFGHCWNKCCVSLCFCKPHIDSFPECGSKPKQHLDFHTKIADFT